MTAARGYVSNGGARRLRSDAAQNVGKIAAAAMEVFAERGLAVSMADVAERAGVGVGTVYRRFGDKAGLIDALFTVEIQRVTDVAEAAAREGDASKAFINYLVTIAEQLAANKGLRQLVLTDEFSPRETHAAALARLDSCTEVLVASAQRDGWLRKDFSIGDFPLIMMAIGAISDSSAPQQPTLWRRLLALTIDGIRVDSRQSFDLTKHPTLTVDELHSVATDSQSPRD